MTHRIPALLIATVAVLTLVGIPGTTNASHACGHGELLFLNTLAVAHAPAGGERHWYRVDVASPAVATIWNTGAQTAMQSFTSGCVITGNTAQLGGSLTMNPGTWYISIWSSEGSDYALTVTSI